MDTIQDSPEETSDTVRRRFWRPKASSKSGTSGKSGKFQSAEVGAPRGRPYSRETDWHTVALVGAGIAAGAVFGAGLALLMAPQSGAHTRLALSREVRRRRPWRRNPWSQLGEELSRAARRKNKTVGPPNVA